jgi:hypothetical protein
MAHHFTVINKDYSFSNQNEDMIDQYKCKPNVLSVLPYDFYWNLENDDFTRKHNERMLDKVYGWIDGHKYHHLHSKIDWEKFKTDFVTWDNETHSNASQKQIIEKVKELIEGK